MGMTRRAIARNWNSNHEAYELNCKGRQGSNITKKPTWNPTRAFRRLAPPSIGGEHHNLSWLNDQYVVHVARSVGAEIIFLNDPSANAVGGTSGTGDVAN